MNLKMGLMKKSRLLKKLPHEMRDASLRLENGVSVFCHSPAEGVDVILNRKETNIYEKLPWQVH